MCRLHKPSITLHRTPRSNVSYFSPYKPCLLRTYKTPKKSGIRETLYQFGSSRNFWDVVYLLILNTILQFICGSHLITFKPVSYSRIKLGITAVTRNHFTKSCSKQNKIAYEPTTAKNLTELLKYFVSPLQIGLGNAGLKIGLSNYK